MRIQREDFLVQVKYADLRADTNHIDKYFLGFGGELYLSAEEITSYDPKVVNNIKSFVINHNPPLRLHAPITEINYSRITQTAFYMQSLYRKVIGLCKVLDINHVVAHAEFDYEADFPPDKQLKNAVSLWQILSDEFRVNDIYLTIENHSEPRPHHLIALMETIDSPYLGLCVDIGHSNAFSNLSIETWLGKYPLGSIKEIHLADNKGDGDTHFPLGEGSIDFAGFFEAFGKRGENSVFVLEPRNIDEARKSLLFLEKRGIL